MVGGGLDDWEVKIADFVPSTAKPSTRQVGFVGERCEKVTDTVNRAKRLWEIRL